MNFIGHAYIARNQPQLIAGNFAGDSYKGNLDKFTYLPDHIQQGIHLHRFIDNFTDTSARIKSVGKIFQNEGVTKVAFIASDILLDHYIIKNWSDYSNETYADFIQIIYKETDKNLIYLEEEFCFLYRKLKQYKWLYQYDTEEGIEMILWQFSRRLGFKNDLLKCMEIYKREKDTIDQHFKIFMDEILMNSKRYIDDLI
ncbi:ACP phosphodiesterase [Crocinitomix catalasitica]|uniref:ACP phosphodiesterase n=1 Tax=Crocinitomix catalasitica TaxID=184607 RepID=UPI00048102C6|nr:ACP phosphodiesterase [Crocinitomix catalasitica]